MFHIRKGSIATISCHGAVSQATHGSSEMTEIWDSASIGTGAVCLQISFSSCGLIRKLMCIPKAVDLPASRSSRVFPVLAIANGLIDAILHNLRLRQVHLMHAVARENAWNNDHNCGMCMNALDVCRTLI